MNKGIDVTKGEYCIFLNLGDSFCDDQTLSMSLPFLDDTDVIAGYAKLDTGEVGNLPKKLLYNHYIVINSPAINLHLSKRCFLRNIVMMRVISLLVIGSSLFKYLFMMIHHINQ